VEIFPGSVVPLPRIGHLIAVKVLSRDDQARPQDLSDLKALMEEAGQDDIELAREALRLVESRGFHGVKSLPQELQSLMELFYAA